MTDNSAASYRNRWLGYLKNLKMKCDSNMDRAKKAECDKPDAWKEGDPPGAQPIFNGGHPDLPSVSAWKITGPPSNPTDLASMEQWKPQNVRLNDAGVIYAILVLSKAYRSKHLAYDFDKRGEVRKTRVPCPPTIVATQNNVVFFRT